MTLSRFTSDSLRIAIIAPTGRSGGERYSRLLSEALEAELLPASLSILRLWSRILRGGYDIVDVQFEYKTFGSHLRSLIALPLLAALLRQPTVAVMTLHGVIEHDSLRGERLGQVKWFGYLVSMRLALTLFRLTIVHSERMRGSLLRYGSSRALVVPHASGTVDCANRDGLKKEILFFGFIRPSKGISNLIAGFNDLRKARPGVRLTIAGSIRSEQEAAYLSSLRRKVANHGLTDSIDFKIGYVSEATKQALAKSASILVLPYTDRFVEVSGVAHDLAGSGIALVCSDTPRFSEFRDKIECLKVRPSPEAIAEALEQLLTDSERAHSLSRNLANFARATSWERVREVRLQIYNELLTSSKLQRPPTAF